MDGIGTLNPFRYRGYYYDEETGLYYLQSRYYDPEVGRFINADEIDLLGADGSLTGYNLFIYCGNSPSCASDRNGYSLSKLHESIDLGVVFLTWCQSISDILITNVVFFEEHHKKGTTNPSNKNKHQEGQARKQRDNGGEKGDKRRKDRSNKRKGSSKQLQSAVIVIGGGILFALILADDSVGIGAADDFLIPGLLDIIYENLGNLLSF